MDSARASILSRSRLFVGSSSIKMSGSRKLRSANTTRAFCPPDKSLILMVWACPGSNLQLEINGVSLLDARDKGAKYWSACRQIMKILH